MTEVVLASQMSEQLVLVKESQLAIFTSRVALVRLVIGIADSSVSGQLRARVHASLRYEDVEIVSADFAVELLVSLPDMFLQLFKLDERSLVAITNRAAMLQQVVEALLDFEVGEGDAVLLLVKTRTQLAIQGGERCNRFRENDLPDDSLSTHFLLSEIRT